MFCKHGHCCVNRLRADLIVIHVVYFVQVRTVSESLHIRTHKPPIKAHKLRMRDTFAGPNTHVFQPQESLATLGCPH